MTNTPVRKTDARRLMAAADMKYTAALRRLEAAPPESRHALVLAAEAGAGAGAGARSPLVLGSGQPAPSFGGSWYDRVASEFAVSLLSESPFVALTPTNNALDDLDEAEYILTGVESVDPQYVDEYEGGDELYNVSIVLEVTIAGTLTRYVPADVLVAAGITPVQYGPDNLAVRLPTMRVQVELAGLLNRDNDDSWELQEQLGYDWLQD